MNATQDKLLGEKWLGRILDKESLSELKEISKNNELTVCGEAGEYHTLVVDGPIFKKRLEIIRKRNVLKDGRWFLEILETTLV